MGIVYDSAQRKQLLNFQQASQPYVEGLAYFSDIMKKASKRLYFLVQLKRSRVPRQDIHTFYTACIRSVLRYAAPAFLCLSIVPKRRVCPSGKTGNVYNMPRTALPEGYRTGEHSPYCRFHHRAMS